MYRNLCGSMAASSKTDAAPTLGKTQDYCAFTCIWGLNSYDAFVPTRQRVCLGESDRYAMNQTEEETNAYGEKQITAPLHEDIEFLLNNCQQQKMERSTNCTWRESRELISTTIANLFCRLSSRALLIREASEWFTKRANFTTQIEGEDFVPYADHVSSFP
jgi:hypothetical protein